MPLVNHAFACVTLAIFVISSVSRTTSLRKNGLSQSKTDLTRGVSQKKLASEAYRATGGVARNSIANRAIVGH